MEFTDALALFILMPPVFYLAVVFGKKEQSERQRKERECRAEINRKKEQSERQIKEKEKEKEKAYEERDREQRKKREYRAEINRKKEQSERQIKEKEKAYEERDREQRKKREYRAEINRKKIEYEEWQIANPNLGYLYVLNNKIVTGYIKIGFTKREKIQERIKEINRGTGVIGKWQLAEKWHVNDPNHCEKLVHKRFKEIRVQKDREFFEIDFKEARLLIHGMMDKRGYYIDKGAVYEYWKDGEYREILKY
jgi:UPF0716 family protein affecting phage T7 exclusion